MSQKAAPLGPSTPGRAFDRQDSTYDLIPGLDTIAWNASTDFSKVAFMGENAVSITGFSPSDWANEPAFWARHMNPDGHFECLRTLRDLPRDQHRIKFEHRAVSKQGTPLWFRTVIHVTRDSAGAIQQLHGLSVEITDYKRTELALRRSVQELGDIKFALDQTSVVVITDTNGIITYANDKFCELSGYAREEIIGKTHRMFKSGYHPREFYEHLWTTIRAGHIWRGEIQNLTKTGKAYWTFMTVVPFLDQAGTPYQFVAIRTDISALKQAEKERMHLVESRAALALAEEAVQTRDRFVSMAAHEIKTPITSLQILLELLQKLRRDSSSQLSSSPVFDQTLKTAVLQTRRLATLVNDMLDMTRITAGRIELRRESINLTDLVRDLIRHFGEDFKVAGCDVRFDDGQKITGFWDKVRIEQVVINLLTNAMKYGHGQPIEVSVGRAGDVATIQVVDHGLGLSKDMREHLFQRFERADAAKQFKGFGLGLWITKQIVDAHRGAIRVVSEEGAGATFVVELPIESETEARSA